MPQQQPMATTPVFPSLEYREVLFQRLKSSGSYQIFTENEMILWFAYHHAWHFVHRNEKRSPLDPDGRWYQPEAVAKAVEMYQNKFGMRAAGKPRRAPTPEEIADAARATRIAIASLGNAGRKVFHDPRAQVREAMGVTATERHPYQNDEAVRRAAKDLGLVGNDQ